MARSKNSVTRYEQIAALIEDLILNGSILPGERIPSVRKLREKTGTSFSTIMQAFSLLESRGFIEVRPCPSSKNWTVKIKNSEIRGSPV